MKTSILLGTDLKNTHLIQENDERVFSHAKSEREALLFHIEHPEVDSYIISPANPESSISLSPSEISSLISHIHFLNKMITVVVLDPGSEIKENLKNHKSVHLVQWAEDIPEVLKNIPEFHRDSNRVEWPVKVQYWENPEEKKHNGLVLSISSSGCFIRTDGKTQVMKNESLSMTIHFKEFDFYTEGKAVWLKDLDQNIIEGIGIKFYDVSPQTKHCIQQIINEKILFELMDKLKPE